jgi:heptosyltransferase-3
MVRTIVILHPGGFGDLLLAVPAIRSLRERYPDHRFLLCGHEQAARFLCECDLVDHWLSVQTVACTALFGGAVPEDSVLRNWLSRCEVAVAWTSDDTGMFAAALRRCGASSAIVQSPFATTLTRLHQSDRFLEIVGEHASPASATSLSVPSLLRAEAATYLTAFRFSRTRPLALVHPGSGSEHKCVKPASLLPVLDRLESHGLETILLEGPADHEMVESILEQRAAPPVLRGLSVSLLAGVLSHVDVFLGHDSGVTHLAALVGTPTVALFGPTNPARWAPRGRTVTVIQENPCNCATWDAVKRCVEKPCLELSSQAIVAACRTVNGRLTPRIC